MIQSRIRAAKSWLIAVTFVTWCSCSSKPNQVADDAATSDQPAETILADARIEYEFAIYYLRQPNKDPLSELDELLKNESLKFKSVDEIRDAQVPCVSSRLVQNVVKEYPPPTKEILVHAGRGLSDAQAEALQDAKAALVLRFSYSKDHVLDGLRTSANVAESLARSAEAFVYDDETREIFTADAWKKRRIDQWKEHFPKVSDHITIHAYKKGDYVRAISLGMIKFGLPDIVIDEFAWSNSGHMSLLINLLAQSLVEGSSAKLPAKFDLDIRAIKNTDMREPQLAALGPKAIGVAQINLCNGTREEGDPANRLIEIRFDRSPGPDVHARQQHLLAACFGSEEYTATIEHDPELVAASRQARTKLAGLRGAFHAGLAPGEYIYVKAPFKTQSGGKEWMWIEVTSWEGEKITGVLGNDPAEVPDLHAGQVVHASEGDVFDYIYHRADGTNEGNETGKLIQRRTDRR